MFLENEYARPLFDFEKGGPPKAFQCLVQVDFENKALHKILGRSESHPCGKITRTERGMRMHLKMVHNWKEQPCLYSTDSQNDRESGAPRKLRAGPPNFQKQESEQLTTEKTQASQRSAETSEGELLKLMNEGS